MTTIESIPNVSEGRHLEVVTACADAVRAAGATLLDVSADASHNRAVLTLASDAARLRAAVHALFDVAIARIDMRRHHGVHPRLGAVDVVPFVPLGETTMDACVDLARCVAAEVAERHLLPVYLYEEAALVDTRRRLELLRRGQFEGLAARLRDPEWRPDFGPAVPHPTAGATVIGARWPLIAFNVNLDSDRLDLARDIAVRIRESSGGLPAVKALGVRLEGAPPRAQVTMNLTNFRQTSMAEAFDAVCDRASQLGVGVRESELIGLVPEAALPPEPAVRLKLTGFDPERQVLERRLAVVA